MARRNTMMVYSHDDPEAKPFLEKIPRYAQQAQTLNIPYWIFVQGSNPIGIVGVGQEPIQLIATPGTTVAIIQPIDTKQPRETIEEFASKALEIAAQRNVEYASVLFPFEEVQAIEIFREKGFKDFDDCYRMVCQLDRDFKPSDALQFKQIQREEMRQFISIAKKFLQGSPDITLTKALQFFFDLPEEFLNFYYTQEEFFFALRDQKKVGVLDINTNRGLISNVAVDSRERGKGYGRQIMLFGLEQLKKSNCKQAYLRVHVENKPAINLYESLGFLKTDRYKTLIWKRQKD